MNKKCELKAVGLVLRSVIFYRDEVQAWAEQFQAQALLAFAWLAMAQVTALLRTARPLVSDKLHSVGQNKIKLNE